MEVPTSPDQIHQDTAQSIANSSNAAGHPTTVENVKAVQPPPVSEEEGMSPSGGEITPSDAVRLIKEEIFGGKPENSSGIGIVRGNEALKLKEGRKRRVGRLLEKIGLKKAA